MLRDVGYTIVHAPAAEVRDLPLQPASFRVILALRSAETGRATIWAPGGAAARAATARLLAPNGRIFGSDRNDQLTSISAGSQASAPLRILDQAVDGGIAVWAAAA
jgi:hypothetical protein